jgi:TPR repeat protein
MRTSRFCFGVDHARRAADIEGIAHGTLAGYSSLAPFNAPFNKERTQLERTQMLSMSHRIRRAIQLALLICGLPGGLNSFVFASEGERTLQPKGSDNIKFTSQSDAQRTDRLLREAAEKTLANRLEAAERGDVVAQSQMGRFYLRGAVNNVKGVIPVDYDLAFKWLSSAAEQNEPLALLDLGTMYFDGVGVKKDYTTALRWFLAAAERHVPRAYGYLWRIYRDGLGTDRDPDVAAYWQGKDLEARRPRTVQ